MFSAMKDRLIRINSVASSSDDLENVELRVRGRSSNAAASNSGQNRDNDSPTWLGSRVLIDRQIMPGDTLNKLALQYSVQVADLKRANNLVSDQDVFALPSIKIPVSRLFADRLLDHPQVEPHHHHPAASSNHAPETNDRRPLLFDESENSEDEHRAHLDALLTRTDANMAQVRGNLPSPNIEGGAFHFVDATSPDTTMRNIWLLIFAVLFIFVAVPLILTLLEEKSEAEAEVRHHHAQISS